jgi:hypothetical protein
VEMDTVADATAVNTFEQPGGAMSGIGGSIQ